MATFNYSTGPVELSDRVHAAIKAAPSSSHMPDGQADVLRCLKGVRQMLDVPEDWGLMLLPGSIRQAISEVLRAVVGSGKRVGVIRSGFWSSFLGDIASSAGSTVVGIDLGEDGPDELTAALAVHVETEYGRLLPIAPTCHALRAAGALVIVDAACSVPIDSFDWSAADLVILGSHKCLGGPPGLGLVAFRNSMSAALVEGPSWPLRAYGSDAAIKYELLVSGKGEISGEPPLPTYPSHLVAGLREAVSERDELGITPQDHRDANWKIREAASELGLDPHVGIDDSPSTAVLRLDVPAHIGADSLRHALLEEGIFVIGNVGASAGGSIRLGLMSNPQVSERSVDRLALAMRRSVARLS